MKNQLLNPSARLPCWLPIAIALVSMGLAWLPPPARAAVKTWDGSSDGNWSTGANWTNGVPPVDGDDVVFPVVADHRWNTNNLGGLSLRSITFDGSSYSLFGNGITLTRGLAANQPNDGNYLHFPVSIGAGQTFSVASADAEVDLLSEVRLNGHDLTFDTGPGLIWCPALLSGTGNLRKTGSGILALSGSNPNTYVGHFTVAGGQLYLDKDNGDAITGVVTNHGTIRYFHDDQIAGAVVLNAGSLLDLHDHSDTLAALSLGGANVWTGEGTLTLGGNLTNHACADTSTIRGNLSLGPAARTFHVDYGTNGVDLIIFAKIRGDSLFAGVVKSGSGMLALYETNTYRGLTLINGGTLRVDCEAALGTTDNGTTVNSGGRLSLSGVHVDGEALTLSSSTDAGTALVCWGNCGWSGSIQVNTNVSVAGGGLELSGAISGPGGLTFISGTCTYSGTNANTYQGSTVVANGTLLLDKHPTDGAVPGPLIIGGIEFPATVRLLQSHQMANADPVTLYHGSMLDLNGYRDTVGGLVFNGGQVETGTGSLALLGDVTAHEARAAASILGELSLNGLVRTFNMDGPPVTLLDISAMITSGGLTKTGPGVLMLSASNSYPLATTINEGTVRIAHGSALGSGASGTTVNPGGALLVESEVMVASEPLSLNGTGPDGAGALLAGDNTYWNTNVTLAGDTSINCLVGAFGLTGAVGGPGSLTKLGRGRLVFEGSVSNAYAGTTTVNEGTLTLNRSIPNAAIPGALVIGDDIGGVEADIVDMKNYAQINDLGAVTINSSGLLDLQGVEEWIGSLAGSGHLALGTGAGVIVGGNGDSTTFSGLISGANSGLLKVGTGRLTLAGSNTYSGQTIAGNGELIVDGSQPVSPVLVSATGTLGGRGTVGHLNCLGGVVQPGASPAILTCSNLVMNASSTLRVELNGITPGLLGYDQLNARGTNNLGSAALEVTLGFAPARDDAFTILNNDGHDKIVGTFAGLTNGAIVSVGLVDFRINYDGGTGNDVVLTITRVYPALAITHVARAGTNLEMRWTSSRPDFVVEKATALETNTNWQPVAGPTKDTRATVPRDTTTGFYRVRGGN